MRRIEQAAIKDAQHLEPVPESAAITILPEARYGYLTLLRVAFRKYPQRAVLGATLMITQSFLYNAIFFTYALVLTKFYHVSNDAVPVYGLAFAVGNLAGPLLLGHLFDTLGRKKMIAPTCSPGPCWPPAPGCFTPGYCTRRGRPLSGSWCSSSLRRARAPGT